MHAHIPTLDPKIDTFAQLRNLNIISLHHQNIKLHLGCGENHINGYINIDFPLSEHTIQTRSGADVFADVTTLKFPPQSITEIRSHHFFEHFNRQTAIALLSKWHEWLVIGGTLYIETPDFERCIEAFLHAPTLGEKQRIIRHIFGSHEAYWATHYDGWFQEKYEHFLTKMGFTNIRYAKNQYLDTYNITVIAQKTTHLNTVQLNQLAFSFLQEYCVNYSPSEQKIHGVWMKEYISTIDNAS